MKQIIELLIAFPIVMSVLVGFMQITSTTSDEHLYYLPSSIVQAFAYDTEYALSAHDLKDLEDNPETVFKDLDLQYPELHYRIKISPLYFQSQRNITLLTNTDGQYLEFIKGEEKVRVCVPEPASVTVIALKTPPGHDKINKTGPKYVESCEEFQLEAYAAHGRSLAIAVMQTQSTVYIAYRFYTDRHYIESYFTLQSDGLVIKVPEDLLKEPDENPGNRRRGRGSLDDCMEAYMIVLYYNGTVGYVTIYLDRQREVNDYYEFYAYWDKDKENRVMGVDGTILAIAFKQRKYDIIAVPFPPAITYGAMPPKDIPVSSYQFITYIDGIPVLVTVEVWRASV